MDWKKQGNVCLHGPTCQTSNDRAFEMIHAGWAHTLDCCGCTEFLTCTARSLPGTKWAHPLWSKYKHCLWRLLNRGHRKRAYLTEKRNIWMYDFSRTYAEYPMFQNQFSSSSSNGQSPLFTFGNPLIPQLLAQVWDYPQNYQGFSNHIGWKIDEESSRIWLLDLNKRVPRKSFTGYSRSSTFNSR